MNYLLGPDQQQESGFFDNFDKRSSSSKGCYPETDKISQQQSSENKNSQQNQDNVHTLISTGRQDQSFEQKERKIRELNEKIDELNEQIGKLQLDYQGVQSENVTLNEQIRFKQAMIDQIEKILEIKNGKLTQVNQDFKHYEDQINRMASGFLDIFQNKIKQCRNIINDSLKNEKKEQKIIKISGFQKTVKQYLDMIDQKKYDKDNEDILGFTTISSVHQIQKDLRDFYKLIGTSSNEELQNNVKQIILQVYHLNHKIQVEALNYILFVLSQISIQLSFGNLETCVLTHQQLQNFWNEISQLQEQQQKQ